LGLLLKFEFGWLGFDWSYQRHFMLWTSHTAKFFISPIKNITCFGFYTWRCNSQNVLQFISQSHTKEPILNCII